MAIIKIKLTEQEWRWLCKDIKEWYQISLTPRQMKKVLAPNKSLMLEVAESIDAYGCDTVTREQVVETISVKLTGTKWPTYGEYHQMGKTKAKKFYAKLIREARKLGYETLDSPEAYMS